MRLFLFVLLFLLLEAELRVVDDTADSGIGGRCNLDEVHTFAFRQSERFGQRQNSKLLGLFTDHADARRQDLVVYSGDDLSLRNFLCLGNF